MWVPGQPSFFKGHEGPNVECIQYGVVEKALDSDSEELDFRPGSATVGGRGARGEFLCLMATVYFLRILLWVSIVKIFWSRLKKREIITNLKHDMLYLKCQMSSSNSLDSNQLI